MSEPERLGEILKRVLADLEKQYKLGGRPKGLSGGAPTSPGPTSPSGGEDGRNITTTNPK